MAEEKELSFSEAIEKAASAIHRFKLIEVKGIPLMEHIANSWDPIWAFQPHPSDLLIATYPKAGTVLLCCSHSYTQRDVRLYLNYRDLDSIRIEFWIMITYFQYPIV